jgi:rSAM/selenodomain-associated transferase 1
MTTLIVMTRLPREGRNKSRLIPALDAAGATAFHDRLARHTFAVASSFCSAGNNRKLMIHIEGGTPAEARDWLGDDTLNCHEQPDGDLGKRMDTATTDAFAAGAEKVIVIGTDCPSLDEATIADAERKLDGHDLVFGPALDGGYYLIGLRQPCPEVFESIPWGGDGVLAASLGAARNHGRDTALLQPLADVDRPEDIPAAEEALSRPPGGC